MKPIPWRTFKGYLKQHAHQDLTPLERELFEFLFPRFQGDPSSLEHAHNKWIESGIEEKSGGLLTLLKGDPRNRRFGGLNFPRGRYFSLAEDSTGDDKQTLAHELRAYRDPVSAGLVEVMDLARGCALKIKEEWIHLDPKPAIAVLIHEFQRLPERLQKIDFELLPALEDAPLRLYRFPYTVKQRTIKHTLDLRFPDVQAWFFRAFRVPAHHLEGWDFTTAYSRFHLEDEKPPTPMSFSEMLPTLVNPDLGGGNPGTTGSTLWSIGLWLRHNGCAALIYPSARAEASVIFDEGLLVGWTGWNLVFYKGSPYLRGVKYFRIDHSPWAWVKLPDGVQLYVPAKGTKYSGGFALFGMVDHSAKDYLGQIQALKIARRVYGMETEHGKPVVPSSSRSFMIGVLTVRWLRLAFEQSPADKVREAVLELVGLTLPYGLYNISGRAVELWSDLYEKGVSDTGRLMSGCLGITQRISNWLSERHSREDLARLLLLGYDIEFFLMGASILLRRSPKDSAIPDPASMVTVNLRQCMELGDDLLDELEAFYTRGAESLRQGPQSIRSVLQSGEVLVNRAYHRLRRDEDH